MPDAIEVVVPMPVNLANARLHWRTRLGHKKRYYGMLDLIASAHRAIGFPDDLPYRIPRPPRVPHPGRMWVEAHLVLGNLMDDDNAMHRMKFVLDWLVTRGYLAGDSRKHIKWRDIPSQEVSRKQPAHVRLTLTPMDEPTHDMELPHR